MGLPGGHAKRGLVAVMVFLDHGIMGQNVGEVTASWGHNWGALQAAEIMENMGEKVPHYVLKNRRSWVCPTAHILGYK
jgi:hypothetical protein